MFSAILLEGSWFSQYGGTILMVVLLIGVFYLMYRSNKKQEKQTNDMRNSLEVGDEVTTIGGIIGEIVRIKDETITIETGKDRTKIRVLRSAIRNVDVHAYEKRGDGKKPESSNDNSGNNKSLKAPVKDFNKENDKKTEVVEEPQANLDGVSEENKDNQ